MLADARLLGDGAGGDGLSLAAAVLAVVPTSDAFFEPL